MTKKEEKKKNIKAGIYLCLGLFILFVFVLYSGNNTNYNGIPSEPKMEVPIYMAFPIQKTDLWGDLEDVDNVKYKLYYTDHPRPIETGTSDAGIIVLKNTITNGKDYKIQLFHDDCYPEEYKIHVDYNLKPEVNVDNDVFIGYSKTNLDLEWNITDLHYVWDDVFVLRPRPEIHMFEFTEDYTENKTVLNVDSWAGAEVYYNFDGEVMHPLIRVDIPYEAYDNVLSIGGFSKSYHGSWEYNLDNRYRDRVSGWQLIDINMVQCKPFTAEIKLWDMNELDQEEMYKQYDEWFYPIEKTIYLNIECRN